MQWDQPDQFAEFYLNRLPGKSYRVLQFGVPQLIHGLAPMQLGSVDYLEVNRLVLDKQALHFRGRTTEHRG